MTLTEIGKFLREGPRAMRIGLSDPIRGSNFPTSAVATRELSWQRAEARA